MIPNCPFDEDPNAGEVLSPAAQKRAIELASNPFAFLEYSMTRRDFLKAAAAAWFSMMLPVRLFRRVAEAAEFPLPASPILLDRTLILLELNGGNDGLNTIIPYTDGAYYDARQRISVPRDQIVKMSHEFGFHPSLAPLLPMWKENNMAVIHGVGYPKPNRSHFRSIAIWETASDSEEYIDEGWLARLFKQNPVPSGSIAEGIVIGNGPAGPLSGPQSRVVNMERPEELFNQSKGLPTDIATSSNPALAHVLDVEREIRQAAAALGERLKKAPVMKTPFPKSRISNHLQVAAKLIASRTPVPVIKLAHGSFDTHSGQKDRHAVLLKELGEGLQAFENSMKELALWDKVLIMTYSEFGRRVSDNDSGGTDHGAAAPHFLMGGRVKGGFYGEAPSLTRLVDGDLDHHVDYRSIYETIAQGWWGLRRDFLPKRTYGPLKCLH